MFIGGFWEQAVDGRMVTKVSLSSLLLLCSVLTHVPASWRVITHRTATNMINFAVF
jgi:hypothetical protein